MRSEETDFNSVCKQENSHGGREGTVKKDWGEMWIANLRGWGDRDTVCGNCYRIPQRAIIHSFTHHVASLLVLACTGLFQVFLWEFVCSFGLLFMLQVGLCVFFFHLSLSCIINVSKPRLSESFHQVLGQLRSRQSVGLCFLLCCPVLLSSGQPVFVVSHSALHEVYACCSCSWFSARHGMADQQE